MLHIQVMGPGCFRCNSAYNVVKIALDETQTEALLEKVSDMIKIVNLGIISTPAIVLNGRVVLAGRVPSVEEVKTWLKTTS